MDILWGAIIQPTTHIKVTGASKGSETCPRTHFKVVMEIKDPGLLSVGFGLLLLN